MKKLGLVLGGGGGLGSYQIGVWKALREYEIDKIIWLLMSGRFYKHSKQAYPLDGRKGKHNKSSAMCRRILQKLD